jgi:hypothetical protein
VIGHISLGVRWSAGVLAEMRRERKRFDGSKEASTANPEERFGVPTMHLREQQTPRDT